MVKGVKYVFLVLCLFFIFPKKVSAQIIINEFLPDSTTEWIEFYNASASADYIKNYYIDDDQDFLSDSGSSSKKILTNLNTSNPNYPYFETSSFLNNSGDYVVLFDPTGVIVDQYQYTSNPGQNMTIGRYPDGTGSFYFLSYSTKADSNPAPPTPTQSPTNPPTVEPTKSPTPSPSKSPSPLPTKSPSPTSSPTPIETTEPIALESQNSLNLSDVVLSTVTPTALVKGAATENRSRFLAFTFFISGTLFLGYGGYLLYNQRYGKNKGTM